MTRYYIVKNRSFNRLKEVGCNKINVLHDQIKTFIGKLGRLSKGTILAPNLAFKLGTQEKLFHSISVP